MCVAAFAWQAHPGYRLVAIGNRDEFHDRPAAALSQWENGILAGQDLKGGGTWLGVSQAGRFALVTNLRGYDLPDPGKASRGALVTDQLTGTGCYGDPATVPLDAFNPFNLIVASGDTAHFLSNRPGEVRTTLPHGIYGLSNGALDEPWPKTLQLKAALADWLAVGKASIAPLFAVLAREQHGEMGLHPAIPSDVPLEARDTPPFIRNAVYGTRCSTVVVIDRQGQGTITERRFDAQGQPAGEASLSFNGTV